MNRVLKILILIFLIPLYWGIESGCTGEPSKISPFGGGQLGVNGGLPDEIISPNGAAPSDQPRQEVIPGPPPGKFFMALNIKTNNETLFAQCQQFTAKMWQDPKKFGVLYAAIKRDDFTATDGGGGIIEEPICKRNGVIDSREAAAITEGVINCDDNSGCCNQYCKFKDLNSECQNQVVRSGGRCTKDHACVVPPTIKINVNTTNPDMPYSYEIPLCPPGPKIVPIEYKVNWDAVVDPDNPLHFRECKTKVDISAELKNSSNGETYKSPLLSGICPSPAQGGECKVDMTLSQAPQADGEILCKYIPIKDIGNIIDTGAVVKDISQ